MPCYHPLRAYQLADGSVVFSERSAAIVRNLTLPCGRCIGCRLEYARQWSVRCMHEASLYAPNNAFITLTYSEENLPYRAMLDYSHFQRFMKRFRRDVNQKLRFFMCGEYGPDNLRPHFHALIFNWRFPDRLLWKASLSGCDLYRSAQLERLWPYGFSTVGDATYQSAGYIARYCIKKFTGPQARKHYERLDVETGEIYQLPPEFIHMSLKPGIGTEFFEKFHGDIYPGDHVIVDGREQKPPRFYDKKFELLDPDAMASVAVERARRMHPEDQTGPRLDAREEVAMAGCNLFSKVRF